jgi:hypothetical protein
MGTQAGGFMAVLGGVNKSSGGSAAPSPSFTDIVMKTTARNFYGVFLAMTACLTLHAQVPRSSLNGLLATSASVSILAFSCKEDPGTSPTLRLLNDPRLPREAGQPIATRATTVAPGVWRVDAQVPVGRWFLRLLSPHCAALIETVSISGESRSFATGLFAGDAFTIDPPASYIAGTLPFTGSTTIFASPDGTPNDAVYPTVVGKFFYFTGLRGNHYVLVVSLGLYQIMFPVDLSSRPGTGFIRHITMDDFKAEIWRAP